MHFFSQKKVTEPKEKDSTQQSEGNEEAVLKSPNLLLQELLQESNSLQKTLQFRFSQRNDLYRHPLCHQSGGITCGDPKQVDKLRSIGKEMIKLVGRKILSGSFNITTISFPITSCYPKTALYNSVVSCSIFPMFMNQAALLKDPLQRFKLTITAIVSIPYYIQFFQKPLNPILGETLQGQLVDETRIYAEQVSHHPPISYFLVYGPQQSYRYSGYYNFEISPGLNSLTMKNIGTRQFVFQDGQIIKADYSPSCFYNTFFGTCHYEQINSCCIIDEANRLSCKIVYGKVKKMPTDYFKTTIMVDKLPKIAVKGTYCGFIEFDKIRYWDGRDVNSLHLDLDLPDRLPSDWSHRIDIQQLVKTPCDMDSAQDKKEALEQAQRSDKKLRKSKGKFV